ncbi:MAG: uridine diphosphate-N-acetylglucosamine-binding protein YvcK [Desulfosarcina sp.]|nr:uridine diphosphate-N-acetylglucosamine-binding protein YvcK [Desulfosarcina sp.]MBC2741514.1 uridine diphosphate-N-acetylglucosamine-binding protein YvcK [Desulfosarcina sp.]MBC2764428.1 uridine diphosphate-N-acetylglucosamine-binding protein YvcK [Desulfosarcina sp.]
MTDKTSKKNKQPVHVVTIGGGSGQYALLSGLRKLAGIRISAVVSMMDSGGSTGRLRDELGTLPPGDILKCILALSPHQETARAIFQKRFNKDRRLKGHNAGNMLLTMLSRYTGSFPAGVQALSEILDVKGEILPVTIDRATLVAELTDGSRIFGESAIDTPRGHQRETIRDVYLVPHHSDAITVYPPVLKAIAKADIIILGPGDLFTSIIPNLIVPGLREKLNAVSAPIYHVVNIMTKFGETNHYQAYDFISTIEGFTGRKISAAIINTQRPDDRLLALYRKQKAEFVDIGLPDTGCQLFLEDLLETSGDVIRHNPEKLAGLIARIIGG